MAVGVLGVFVVMVMVVVIVGVRFVTEQRAVQLLLAEHAVGGLWQAEQHQRLLQLRPYRGDLGLVCRRAGGVFEAHQVHRRAVQFQLQGLAVQRCVQAADAMLVGAEAGVLMIVVMFFGRLGDGQWQQGKRQSEKQTAHGKSPGRK